MLVQLGGEASGAQHEPRDEEARRARADEQTEERKKLREGVLRDQELLRRKEAQLGANGRRDAGHHASRR